MLTGIGRGIFGSHDERGRYVGAISDETGQYAPGDGGSGIPQYTIATAGGGVAGGAASFQLRLIPAGGAIAFNTKINQRYLARDNSIFAATATPVTFTMSVTTPTFTMTEV